MLPMVRLKHVTIHGEPVAVGDSRYHVDDEGCVTVRPEDAPKLVSLAGFVVVGEAEGFGAECFILPRTEAEFVATVKAAGLSPNRLRQLADILERIDPLSEPVSQPPPSPTVEPEQRAEEEITIDGDEIVLSTDMPIDMLLTVATDLGLDTSRMRLLPKSEVIMIIKEAASALGGKEE